MLSNILSQGRKGNLSSLIAYNIYFNYICSNIEFYFNYTFLYGKILVVKKWPLVDYIINSNLLRANIIFVYFFYLEEYIRL